jgi:hypothetical protein
VLNLVVTLALFVVQAPPDSLPLYRGLPLGPHRVGLAVLPLESAMAGAPGRRGAVYVWYPALLSRKAPLTIGDLWCLAAREGVFETGERSDARALALAATGDSTAWAIQSVASRFALDTMRVALLAWSYDGQSIARLQRSLPGVGVVVSADANVVPADPAESLELRRPLTWLVGQTTARRGYERRDSLPMPAVLVRLPTLTHGSFNALESYIPALAGAAVAFRWSANGAAAITGYQTVVRIVLAAVLDMGRVGATPSSVSVFREAAGSTQVVVTVLPGTPNP